MNHQPGRFNVTTHREHAHIRGEIRTKIGEGARDGGRLPATRNRLRLAGDTTNLDKLESYLEKYERLKELAATCPSGSCSLIRKLEGEGPKYFAALDI